MHLGIQSWVHNYLQGGIGKNGRLKRVKRSHLSKLSDTYIKIYDCIMIQLVDFNIDDDGILKQIARYTRNWQKNLSCNDIVLVGDANGDSNGLDRFEVAELCLLFKFYYHDDDMENQEVHNLAYMQWFCKKSHHNVNQMIIVDIMEKFNVIAAEAIYHLMHLIPKFKIVVDVKTAAENHVPANKYQ